MINQSQYKMKDKTSILFAGIIGGLISTLLTIVYLDYKIKLVNLLLLIGIIIASLIVYYLWDLGRKDGIKMEYIKLK